LLPHNHFLIAGLAMSSFAVALWPDKSLQDIVEWVVIGGLISAALDLDIVTLVWLKSQTVERLKLFRNPLAIYCQFDLFMEAITETGILRTGLISHLCISTIIVLLSRLFAQLCLAPVTIAVLSHILSDIPNRRRLTA